MQTLSRVNRQPLYQQVRQILLKTIQSGEWKPGEKIPIEPVLAQQVGVPSEQGNDLDRYLRQ